MTMERPMFPPTRRAFINTMATLPIAVAAAAAPAATADPSPDAEPVKLGAGHKLPDIADDDADDLGDEEEEA